MVKDGMSTAGFRMVAGVLFRGWRSPHAQGRRVVGPTFAAALPLPDFLSAFRIPPSALQKARLLPS